MSTPLLAPDLFDVTVVLSDAEAEVVRAVREGGPLSRSDLKERLGSSRAAVTATLNRLLNLGVLKAEGPGESRGGRRPLTYGINGGFGFVSGVDIGATSIDVALADFSGRILARHAEPANVEDGPLAVLGQVCQTIATLIETQGGRPAQLLAAGIGVPGPVEFSRGVLIAPPLMPTWEDYPIKQFIVQYFPNARVVVDNDVNVMAIGERHTGAGRGKMNFIFLKIGTGIGAGIIAKGQIYRGSDGAAGDVGHICIDYNGPICHCGNAGCLEAMAAGPAIAARATEAAMAGRSEFLAARLVENDGVLSAKDVNDAAAAGDPVANEIVKSSGRMIGGMLAGLVNFFNPQLILIGGGVSQIGYKLLSAIRQSVLRRSTALSTRHLRIEFSSLGADAGIHGAVWLALEHVFITE